MASQHVLPGPQSSLVLGTEVKRRRVRVCVCVCVCSWKGDQRGRHNNKDKGMVVGKGWGGNGMNLF